MYVAPKSQMRISAHWRGALWGKMSRLKIRSFKMMSERGECLSLTDMKRNGITGWAKKTGPV